MSAERISELRERLYLLERSINPLEWDMARNQINEFKRVELAKLKAERSSLLEELKGLDQPRSA